MADRIETCGRPVVGGETFEEALARSETLRSQTPEVLESMKSGFWHTGLLTPQSGWRALETRFPLAQGEQEPDRELRERFCKTWNRIKEVLKPGVGNAWLSPGPLSLELRTFNADPQSILDIRKMLHEEFGDVIQFRF